VPTVRIAAVAHTIPSRRVTNDDVVAMVRAQCAGRAAAGAVDALVSRTRAFLAAAGTEVRYCTGAHEKPIDLAARTVAHALERAGIAAGDVDFLVYAGVMRGWLEPSTASAVQAAAGLRRATSFDVLDACAGWLRALELARGLLQGGQYRCGVIVNAECGTYRAGLHAAETASLEELEWRLAGYTLGEAATATVVHAAPPEAEPYVRFRTLPEHHRLCMVPLPWTAEFLEAPIEPPPAPLRFFADSRTLLRVAVRAVIDGFRADERLGKETYDVCFGHAASAKVERIIAQQLGFSEIYYSIHARYGNTASASIPLAMSLAEAEGRLRRGHRVLVAVGASGLSVGFGVFTF
jgi:3-oxoacyl-[acyl-carrier-protein] synthase III